MTTSDLIIIGSGPGGYRAAGYAAQNGLKVIIFEAEKAGGTCLNCGCIPTKALCHDAETLLLAREELGLTDAKADFLKIAARKQQVVEQLRSGVETLLASPGITLVREKAVFMDAHTIVAGGEEYSAPHIIIATGSRAKLLPVEGIDGHNVLTSTELLDIDHIPARLCIIGAGVVGMEFASVFASFGSQVTVVEFMKECLPNMDSDIAKRLRKCMERRGVKFQLQAGVKKIDGNNVFYDRKGKEEVAEADCILVATGRAANTEGLSLEVAGVETGRGGIILTDENMQTNVAGVYAIGDVNGRQMLAHAATFQGFRAVNHILGKTDNIRFDIMPAAVFTYPEAASVGLTEQQCKDSGVAYECRKGYYRANGKALATNASEGLVKLLANEQGVIIGCHAYGAHAADMVQEVSTLMNSGTTLQQLREMIHIHPTLGEILQEMA